LCGWLALGQRLWPIFEDGCEWRTDETEVIDEASVEVSESLEGL